MCDKEKISIWDTAMEAWETAVDVVLSPRQREKAFSNKKIIGED